MSARIEGERLADSSLEWLETDGFGGFASGTVGLERTRRYHGLLLAATRPPTGRMMLVNGLEAWIETADGRQALSTHRYRGDVLHPDGRSRLTAFESEPWPRWTFRLDDGTTLVHELLVRHESPLVALTWRASRPLSARLVVRPLLSGRDFHSLHHENPAFRFDAEIAGARVRWRPYEGLPAISAFSSGGYEHQPDWYRAFLYAQETARGLDDQEDLASPGRFVFDLSAGDEACLLFLAEGPSLPPLTLAASPACAFAARVREQERVRRASFASPLLRAADSYLVRRGNGLSLVAGYPWFADWGRDTFLALRGLLLATGRLAEAESVLLQWAGLVSEGLLPNGFVDEGGAPAYNSADASLWYVVAVHEHLTGCERAGRRPAPRTRATLSAAVRAILDGYAAGTRYGITADEDGLLAAGEPGWQLTWMDARADGREITPRCGKPVELQALWVSALAAGRSLDLRLGDLERRARASFAARFWNEAAACLYDVVDVDHVAGTTDPAVRPNQILAVGGLPWPLLDGRRARSIVDVVERQLWTPLGLRSLAPDEAEYVPHYVGGPSQRDAAYHQGTVWPWLTGPFVEAWIAVRGGTPAARRAARARFVAPLLAHLDEAGLGHVSEITDAEAPFVPRGAPFQAWSLGELLRLEHLVLAGRQEPAARGAGASA